VEPRRRAEEQDLGLPVGDVDARERDAEIEEQRPLLLLVRILPNSKPTSAPCACASTERTAKIDGVTSSSPVASRLLVNTASMNHCGSAVLSETSAVNVEPSLAVALT
jgi:hypothetical protein